MSLIFPQQIKLLKHIIPNKINCRWIASAWNHGKYVFWAVDEHGLHIFDKIRKLTPCKFVKGVIEKLKQFKETKEYFIFGKGFLWQHIATRRKEEIDDCPK